MNTIDLEKRSDSDRRKILEGDYNLALSALTDFEYPVMTAFMSLVAAVKYGWCDDDIINAIKAAKSWESNIPLYNKPFGMFAISTLNALGVEPYRGNDPEQIRINSDKMRFPF